MSPITRVPFRVNQVDESKQIDGGAETLEHEIKNDQEQAVRRAAQKTGRFYDSLTKLFGRKVEEEKKSPKGSVAST
jgi:hypothetical protein